MILLKFISFMVKNLIELQNKYMIFINEFI